VKLVIDRPFKGPRLSCAEGKSVHHADAGFGAVDGLRVCAIAWRRAGELVGREPELQAGLGKPKRLFVRSFDMDKGFCERVVVAGCAGYIVSFSGRRALYVGRTAETHVEHFPN
jgi:hypothetical protein